MESKINIANIASDKVELNKIRHHMFEYLFGTLIRDVGKCSKLWHTAVVIQNPNTIK